MNDDMFNTNVNNSLLNDFEPTNNLSFFEQQEKSKNNTKINKTYINIDSRNRNITNKLDFNKIISINSLDPDNYLSTQNGSNKIIFKYSTDKISFDEWDKVNEFEKNITFVLTGLIPDNDGKLNGIPIEFLNYTDINNGPIHYLRKYNEYNGINYKIQNGVKYNYVYFTINYNTEYITTGRINNNFEIKTILNLDKGYNNTNYYKIKLAKPLRNIISVSLVSSEIPNAVQTITHTTTINETKFKQKINNRLRWINEDDNVLINDKKLHISQKGNNTCNTVVKKNKIMNSLDNYDLSMNKQIFRYRQSTFENTIIEQDKHLNGTKNDTQNYNIIDKNIETGVRYNLNSLEYTQLLNNENTTLRPNFAVDNIPEKVNINVKNYRKYNVNEVILPPGLYNENQFSIMLNNLFKPNEVKHYNWNTENWHHQDSYDSYISKTKGDLINVKLEKVTSKLEFKQYKDITNDIQVEGNLVSNEGYPYLYLINYNFKLSNGSRIRIEGSSDVLNIPKEEINTDHTIRIGKVYNYSLRLIYPIPQLDYFYSEDELFNEYEYGIENENDSYFAFLSMYQQLFAYNKNYLRMNKTQNLFSYKNSEHILDEINKRDQVGNTNAAIGIDSTASDDYLVFIKDVIGNNIAYNHLFSDQNNIKTIKDLHMSNIGFKFNDDANWYKGPKNYYINSFVKYYSDVRFKSIEASGFNSSTGRNLSDILRLDLQYDVTISNNANNKKYVNIALLDEISLNNIYLVTKDIVNDVNIILNNNIQIDNIDFSYYKSKYQDASYNYYLYTSNDVFTDISNIKIEFNNENVIVNKLIINANKDPRDIVNRRNLTNYEFKIYPNIHDNSGDYYHTFFSNYHGFRYSGDDLTIHRMFYEGSHLEEVMGELDEHVDKNILKKFIKSSLHNINGSNITTTKDNLRILAEIYNNDGTPYFGIEFRNIHDIILKYFKGDYSNVTNHLKKNTNPGNQWYAVSINKIVHGENNINVDIKTKIENNEQFYIYIGYMYIDTNPSFPNLGFKLSHKQDHDIEPIFSTGYQKTNLGHIRDNKYNFNIDHVENSWTIDNSPIIRLSYRVENEKTEGSKYLHYYNVNKTITEIRSKYTDGSLATIHDLVEQEYINDLINIYDVSQTRLFIGGTYETEWKWDDGISLSKTKYNNFSNDFDLLQNPGLDKQICISNNVWANISGNSSDVNTNTGVILMKYKSNDNKNVFKSIYDNAKNFTNNNYFINDWRSIEETKHVNMNINSFDEGVFHNFSGENNPIKAYENFGIDNNVPIYDEPNIFNDISGNGYHKGLDGLDFMYYLNYCNDINDLDSVYNVCNNNEFNINDIGINKKFSLISPNFYHHNTNSLYFGNILVKNDFDSNYIYNSIISRFKDTTNQIDDENTVRYNLPYLENIGVENPFDQFELLANTEQDEDKPLSLGRILKLDKYTNGYGNLTMNVEFPCNSHEPFKIGDIVMGLNSNSIAMIVPKIWGKHKDIFPLERGLMTDTLIHGGLYNYISILNQLYSYRYINYENLEVGRNEITSINNQQTANININPKTEFRENDVLTFESYKYLISELINSSTDNRIYRDISNIIKKGFWPIQELNNAQTGFEFKVNHYPSESVFDGLGSSELKIFKPKKFKFIFDTDDTPKYVFGIEQYGEKSTELEFNDSHSNYIQSSKLFISKMYINQKNIDNDIGHINVQTNYISDYKTGDIVYFKDLYLNNEQYYDVFIDKLEPFKNYIENIKLRLTCKYSDIPIPNSIYDITNKYLEEYNKLNFNIDGDYIKYNKNIDISINPISELYKEGIGDTYAINYILKNIVNKNFTINSEDKNRNIKRQLENSYKLAINVVDNIKKYMYNNLNNMIEQSMIQDIHETYKTNNIVKLILLCKFANNIITYGQVTYESDIRSDVFHKGMDILYEENSEIYRMGKVVYSSLDTCDRTYANYGKLYYIYVKLENSVFGNKTFYNIKNKEVFLYSNWYNIEYKPKLVNDNIRYVAHEYINKIKKKTNILINEENSAGNFIKNDKKIITAQILTILSDCNYNYFYDDYLSNKCIIKYNHPYRKSDYESLNNMSEYKYLNNNVINYDAKPFFTLETGNNILIQKIGKKNYRYNKVKTSDIDITGIGNETKKSSNTNKQTLINNLSNQNKLVIDVNNKRSQTDIKYGVNVRVLNNLWPGNLDTSSNYILSDYGIGQAFLSDLEWTPEIQDNMFYHNKMRINPNKVNIIGNNGINYLKYNESFFKDSNTRIFNEITIVLKNSVSSGNNEAIFTTRIGNDDIYYSNDKYNDISYSKHIKLANVYNNQMIRKNFMLHFNNQFIEDDKNSNSETAIIKNVEYMGNNEIKVTFYSELINNHSVNEQCIQKFYYVGIDKMDINDEYLSISGTYELHNNIYKDISSNYLSVFINYGDKKYGQMNTIKKIEVSNGYYNVYFKNKIRDELKNYMYNDISNGTTLIYDAPHHDHHLVFMTYDGSGIYSSNTINNNMLSTQPFYVNNGTIDNPKIEWYTKIFYQGNKCINPLKSDYINDATKINKEIKDNITTLIDVSFTLNENEEYDDNFNTGLPIFNNNYNGYIYINGMKGYHYNTQGITSKSYREIILEKNNSDHIDNYILNKRIGPVNDGLYRVENIDVLSISGFELNIPNFYDNYNLGKFIEIKKNGNISYEWVDFTMLNDKDGNVYNNLINGNSGYINNYYSVTIKGKYMGFGGNIKPQNKDDNSYFTNTDGFKVTNVVNNNNKSIISIDANTNYINLERGLRNKNLTSYYNNNVRDNNITLSNSGVIYKKTLKAPYNIKGSDYIFMCCPTLSTLHETDNVRNQHSDFIFAKILLPTQPGKSLFNTFINIPKRFEHPLNLIEELEFYFIDSEGFLYDFNKRDHSFTLEITEELESF